MKDSKKLHNSTSIENYKEFLKLGEKLKNKVYLPVTYKIKEGEYAFNLNIISDKELNNEDLEMIKESNEEAVHQILSLNDLINAKTGHVLYYTNEPLKKIKNKKVLFFLTKDQ